MGQKIAMLVNRAAWDQNLRPKRGERFLKAGSAIGDDELRRLQAAFDEIIEERPPGSFAFSTHVLDRQEPRAMRSEIEVDFLSSLTRTTVPSRISRVIGSSVRERAFQAPQSPFTWRQTRLPASFPPGAAKQGRHTPRS